jgi:hypothetical protein
MGLISKFIQKPSVIFKAAHTRRQVPENRTYLIILVSCGTVNAEGAVAEE